MGRDFSCYLDSDHQRRTAGELIIFGAEQFKSAKLISNLPLLEEIADEYSKKQLPLWISKYIISPMMFDYLTDSIKISIFFENYMKGELLINDFLIHEIINDEKYNEIRERQKKQPIKLKELNDIELFIVDSSKPFVDHYSLTPNTLKFKVMLKKEKYRTCFLFRKDLDDLIEKFYNDRNNIHYYTEVNFILSRIFITNVKAINEFVESCVSRIQNK